jgi:mono/diheme cytochrome c family protein
MSRTGLCVYLILMLVASGCVAAAGYFGGNCFSAEGVFRVGAAAGIFTSVLILVATFTAGGIYRTHARSESDVGSTPLAAENLPAKGRAFFFQSCAHCHGQDADGGEDAPGLLKLQISGAHMALVIQNGIKDEMPSFAKKYNEHETTAIVAYLKTLH